MYYMRKPFYVSAFQVTEENLESLSEEHGLDIRTAAKTGARYLKVKVLRPLNDRQTKAFVGDWLLVSENGYKVYTQAAFEKNFIRVSAAEDRMLDAIMDPIEKTLDGIETRMDEIEANAIALVKSELGATIIEEVSMDEL